VDFTRSADEALAAWWSWLARWRDGLATVTAEQLDQVGFGQYPWGLDRSIAFVGIVWWVNQEVIHHLAEIALLRDLWRAGLGQAHCDVG
jgi:DinB superfamily